MALNAPKIFNAQGFNPFIPAVILISAQNSAAVQLQGFVLCGIMVPAAFTGVALTFLVSINGVDYYPLRSTTSGTALSYTVAQGQYIAIDPKDFYGVNYLKVVSGSAEAAARTLNLAVRGF